jgi:hypothetical protein
VPRPSIRRSTCKSATPLHHLELADTPTRRRDRTRRQKVRRIVAPGAPIGTAACPRADVRVYSGSVGDRDAVAPVVLSETAEMAVSLVPCARREIGSELLSTPPSGIPREESKPRHSGLDLRIEIRVGSRPECRAEAVPTIVWHEHRSDISNAQRGAYDVLAGRVLLRWNATGRREVFERPEVMRV